MGTRRTYEGVTERMARESTEGSRAGAGRGAASLLPTVLFLVLVLAYIWLVQPAGSKPLEAAVLVVLVAIPILTDRADHATLREVGFRVDDLARSAREVGVATLVLGAAAVAIGLAARGTWLAGVGPSFPHDLQYLPWALVQQYALQRPVYARIRTVLASRRLSAAMAALLFSTVHLPNLPLVGATIVAGYVWCRLYEREPNLFTLAVSHALLALFLQASWPASWLHDLRIGPGYLHWSP